MIDTPAARGPLPTVRSTPLLLRLVALVGLGLACRAGALVVEHPCCANHLHVCVPVLPVVCDSSVDPRPTIVVIMIEPLLTPHPPLSLQTKIAPPPSGRTC